MTPAFSYKHKVLSSLCLSFLPGIYFFLAILHETPAAMAMHRSLTSYFFLFNGFLLASGHSQIHFSEHPGYPLTLLVGALAKIKLFLLGFDPESIKAAFVLHNEEIFEWIVRSFVFLNALCLFVFGKLALRRFSLGHVLVAQALFFASPSIIEKSTVLRPEALAVGVACINSLFFIGALPRFLLPPFLGTLFSLKFIYAPFASEVFLFKGRRAISLAIFVSALFALLYFFFLSQNNCVTCPAEYLYESVLNFVTGKKASGPPRPPSTSWADLSANAVALSITVAVFIVAIITTLRRPNGDSRFSPLRIATFLLSVQFAFFLIYPGQFHYLFPALGLSPALYLLSLDWLTESRRRLFAVLLASALFANAYFIRLELFQFQERFIEMKNENNALNIILEKNATCLRFIPGAPINKQAQLFLANQSTNLFFAKELSSAFPNDYTSINKDDFYDFFGRPTGWVALKNALKEKKCALMLTRSSDPIDQPLELKFRTLVGNLISVQTNGTIRSLYLPGKQ